ncbi:hypothetical protein SAMN04488029_2202 [Reichenbachiella faecimaris]|uniref:G8 domain-containing protein n=1 Tax=Reichenbachiella faecimaris TaxID=692418 RepID=A0A1W2GDU3_REIFA|nr:hypothetical protein [Reichenbachiella faecimaris]SMD34839.1 hypothetical protein SAMN04488029_2202 [Reichenbachiella faecimaris]
MSPYNINEKDMICSSFVYRFGDSVRCLDKAEKLLLMLMLLAFSSSATTYTTISTGTWDANGAPPSPLLSGDVVNVNHDGVYFDWPNTVTIQSGATFNINNGGNIQLMNLVIDDGGIMTLGAGGILRSVGSITNNSDHVVIDGELTDNSSFVNNGAITGSGTITVSGSASGSGTVNGTNMDDVDWSEEVDMSEPLPVTLVFLRAKFQNDQVVIEWLTSSETNNNYFSIERSKSGDDWEVIGELAGSGNSNSNRSYMYIDRQPQKGRIYYRIKQTDFDGKFEYFDAVKVNVGASIHAVFANSLIQITGEPGTHWLLFDLQGHVKQSGIIAHSGMAILNPTFGSGLFVLKSGESTYKVSVR